MVYFTFSFSFGVYFNNCGILIMNEKAPGFWTVLSDNAGGFSSMRVAFLLWMLVVCFNWTYLSIKANKLEPLDGSIVTMTAALGIAKAAQRIGEKADPETPPIQ